MSENPFTNNVSHMWAKDINQNERNKLEEIVDSKTNENQPEGIDLKLELNELFKSILGNNELEELQKKIIESKDQNQLLILNDLKNEISKLIEEKNKLEKDVNNSSSRLDFVLIKNKISEIKNSIEDKKNQIIYMVNLD